MHNVVFTLTNHLHQDKGSIHIHHYLAHNKCHRQGNFHLLGMERQTPVISMHNVQCMQVNEAGIERTRCTNTSYKEHLAYSEKVTTQENNSRSQEK